MRDPERINKFLETLIFGFWKRTNLLRLLKKCLKAVNKIVR